MIGSSVWVCSELGEEASNLRTCFRGQGEAELGLTPAEGSLEERLELAWSRLEIVGVWGFGDWSKGMAWVVSRTKESTKFSSLGRSRCGR